MSDTTQRRIFIGDVHGHYNGLMTLLETIAPGADDQVYFLGDLIDRGPQSSQVLSFIRKSRYQSLMGNHEQLLIDSFPNGQLSVPALQAWLYSGGQATMESYRDVTVLLDDLEWIRTLPTHLDLGDIWLAHAGVHPKLPLEEQTAQELCWVREEFHSMSEPYFTEKVIITGHTITFTLPGVAPGEVAHGHGWYGIDTGAYHHKSGWLTALDMTRQQVHQVNVFQNLVRSLPLAEIVVWVEPAQVTARYHSLRKHSTATST